MIFLDAIGKFSSKNDPIAQCNDISDLVTAVQLLKKLTHLSEK